MGRGGGELSREELCWGFHLKELRFSVITPEYRHGGRMLLWVGMSLMLNEDNKFN